MATVPASSNVMLVGTMLAFFATSMMITFTPPLIWWAIPAVCAGAVAVIATLRVRRHRRMRRAVHGARL